MPIALLLALVLGQAAPSEAASAPASVAAASPEDATANGANSLPKDDYGLVAWCHGALAGQLELDPIAHADMVSIEGKAKVTARAKNDALIEKDRREYLHAYERALAAAEKASPTAIHQYGVESELAGYKLWGVTRQKQPIWRMLDWGMWDANDAGCGEAAKRLYNKSTLFGEALKGHAEAKPVEAEAAVPPATTFTARGGAPVSDVATVPDLAAGRQDAPAAEASASAADKTPSPAATEGEAIPPPKSGKTAAKPKSRIAKVKAAHTIAPKAAVDPASATAPEPAPALKPADEPLRGPQR